MNYFRLFSNVILFFLTLFTTSSYSQDSTRFILDLPVFEAPYGATHSFLAYRQFSPGMQASLGLHKSVTETKTYYLKRLMNFKKGKTQGEKIGRRLGFIFLQLISEVVLIDFPLGMAWNHEEWHRAVLTQNNVRSYNDVNNIPLGQDIIAVSHLIDADLASFKKNNNPDFVRMSAAGMEGDLEAMKALQKDNFFNDMNLPLGLNYALTALNTAIYVASSSREGGEETTIAMEKKEGTTIEKRDFTGLDMAAWMYDLSRPAEPYEARGIHPSGVGIRRYRRPSDLTDEELGYLKMMGRFQLANFISPAMFSFHSIRINKDVRFNINGFHYLASFGYDVGANLFLEYKGRKIFVALHRYRNLNNGFAGLEVQALDCPLRLGRIPLLVSPALHLWTQPKGQEFRTSESSFGGRMEVTISTKVGKCFRPYAVIAAKTKGWVAGDSYLEERIFGRIGVRAYIH